MILCEFLQWFLFAALRELYRTKAGNYSSESLVMTKDIGLPITVKEDVKIKVSEQNNRPIDELVEVQDEVDDREIRGRTSLMGLNDSDEFFDVPESTEYDHFDNPWHSDMSSEQISVPQPRLSSAAGLVKKLHDLAS